ncbi:DEAD/DEAH box helicase family protein [Micromonospora globbae]|jgi:superfamily II DNA or RNA helicase|uniref:DEAD/DEAH box helicase family protein n=1 Tax=Micromonospora globbae TaxID=1894969 RepID=A0ABZ1S1I7_9ACTN|nr:DEAD/DEAH box helicase family protein [Micromonospora globbae]WTF86887.1 DEAD/DEAH box helicase family protein [Micromonospora globbae]
MSPVVDWEGHVATLAQGYGHVIVDECHDLDAASYEHSVKRIAAQFWLGLTATPPDATASANSSPGNSDPSAIP